MVDLTRCMDRLGYRFHNVGLLRRALTHSSLAAEQHRLGEDNERLEYLGDAVLEHLVSRYIYDAHPEMREGAMTRLRSALVCMQIQCDWQPCCLGDQLSGHMRRTEIMLRKNSAIGDAELHHQLFLSVMRHQGNVHLLLSPFLTSTCKNFIYHTLSKIRIEYYTRFFPDAQQFFHFLYVFFSGTSVLSPGACVWFSIRNAFPSSSLAGLVKKQ